MTQQTKEKRKFLRGDLSFNRAGALDIAGLSDLARAHPEHFMAKCADLIAQRKITLRKIPDLAAFFRAFVNVTVPAVVEVGAGVRAVVDTSAFPLLMGNLVVDEINAAYDLVPTIGQDLVRDMDSNKKWSTVVKMQHLTHKNVATKEGDEFPLISAGEQYAQIGHNRKGFQLAITQETIEENDLGNFIDLIDQGGEFAAELGEEQTLSRACDQNGSAASPAEPYVYHPNGAAASMYTTSTTALAGAPNGTRKTNNPLALEDNLEAARAVLASMLNSRGKRIAIPMSETTLLVPDALVGVAAKLLNSELTPGSVNEINNWGPRGRYRPMLRSSPKLDDISTTAWYLGAFQRQFVRKWKIRLETVSVYADAMQYAKTREAYRTRVAWDMEIGARDHVFVVQNLAGTTAPSAATGSD